MLARRQENQNSPPGDRDTENPEVLWLMLQQGVALVVAVFVVVGGKIFSDDTLAGRCNACMAGEIGEICGTMFN